MKLNQELRALARTATADRLSEDLAEDDIESVRQIKNPSKAKIRDEVLAIFKDTRTRDMVARHAPNLAKAPLFNGTRPGLRMEIPRDLV